MTMTLPSELIEQYRRDWSNPGTIDVFDTPYGQGRFHTAAWDAKIEGSYTGAAGSLCHVYMGPRIRNGPPLATGAKFVSYASWNGDVGRSKRLDPFDPDDAFARPDAYPSVVAHCVREWMQRVEKDLNDRTTAHMGSGI